MKTRVLVIEDNELNLYLVRFLLERCNCEVAAARDGNRGLEMAAEVLPDLVILDIQLPGMNGYTVARRLRKIEALANVPIIAVTSHAMVGDREQTMAAGCTGYIEKPIDPHTFSREVLGFLATQ